MRHKITTGVLNLQSLRKINNYKDSRNEEGVSQSETVDNIINSNNKII
jgi:hypothetical protein